MGVLPGGFAFSACRLPAGWLASSLCVPACPCEVCSACMLPRILFCCAVQWRQAFWASFTSSSWPQVWRCRVKRAGCVLSPNEGGVGCRGQGHSRGACAAPYLTSPCLRLLSCVAVLTNLLISIMTTSLEKVGGQSSKWRRKSVLFLCVSARRHYTALLLVLHVLAPCPLSFSIPQSMECPPAADVPPLSSLCPGLRTGHQGRGASHAAVQGTGNR